MKKFLINIFLFGFLSLILGETIVRTYRLNRDVPQRTIDADGIQKFVPNQKGYWAGGDFQWQTNKLGWSGKLPDKYNNLISVIGDSYIANLMNPIACHQNIYLKKQLPKYNFIEAARPGVTFIEAIEISQSLTSLNPKHHLIYVKDHDFIESIREIKQHSDRTQISLKNSRIFPGKIKNAIGKKILYNWKLAFYFFNRLANLPENEESAQEVVLQPRKYSKHLNKIYKLLKITSTKYDISNIILVLHPNSNSAIASKANELGFKILKLNSESRKWNFDHDQHWTCYGHKRVASQIGDKFKQDAIADR